MDGSRRDTQDWLGQISLYYDFIVVKLSLVFFVWCDDVFLYYRDIFTVLFQFFVVRLYSHTKTFLYYYNFYFVLCLFFSDSFTFCRITLFSYYYNNFLNCYILLLFFWILVYNFILGLWQFCRIIASLLSYYFGFNLVFLCLYSHIISTFFIWLSSCVITVFLVSYISHII